MMHVLVVDRRRVAAALRAFHQSPLSMSSVQPLLDLAVEYNPDLRDVCPFPADSLLQPVDTAPDAHLGATEAV